MVILTPFILTTVVITSIASGFSQHNRAAVDAVFNEEYIADVPYEYQNYIYEMNSAFKNIDKKIKKWNAILTLGSLDDIEIKALFFSLYFANVGQYICEDFVKCFIRVEITYDQEGNQIIKYYPLHSYEAYSNLEGLIGRNITPEEKANSQNIYNYIKYGYIYDAAANEGNIPQNNIHKWIENNYSSEPFIGRYFDNPLDIDWRNSVSSEFGQRVDPFNSSRIVYHSGIDIAAPAGTPIRAANSGVIMYAGYNSSYGNYVIIDHGGRVATLYAHCSSLLSVSGQKIKKGDVIALVGSTGDSTGYHLHIEFIIEGQPQNARNFLQ